MILKESHVCECGCEDCGPKCPCDENCECKERKLDEVAPAVAAIARPVISAVAGQVVKSALTDEDDEDTQDEAFSMHGAMHAADQYAMNDEQYLRSKADELDKIADRIKSGAADSRDIEILRDMAAEMEEQADTLFRKNKMVAAK